MDDDNTIEYQCTTCTIQWTPGDDIFIIYNSDATNIMQVSIYCGFSVVLNDVANEFNCQYEELLSTIASIVITFTYNELNRLILCKALSISKDEAAYGYKNKIYFTHDIAENIKIIQDILNSHTIGTQGLKNSIIELTYALSTETQSLPGYTFDKKFVICFKDKCYMVNEMTVYETDASQRESLGHNLVAAQAELEGMDGETIGALITKDRLWTLAQGSDTSIVKKLCLTGQQVMTCKEMQNILRW